MSFFGKFQEFGFNFANQRHMSAIKDGILSVLPATLAGSVFLIIRFLPIPGWNNILESIFGSNYGNILSYPVAATFDLVGLIALISISYRLSEHYKIDALTGCIIALCGYFTLTPNFYLSNVNGLDEAMQVNGVWALQYTGTQSLFVIIMCAIFSVEIYRMIIEKKIVIKLPDMVPPNVSNSFIAIIPMFVVLLIMFCVRLLVSMTEFETIHKMVNTLIQTPLMNIGNSIFGYSIMVFFKDLLWTIGIHGPNVMSPIMQPMELAFSDANRIAYEAGESLPYIFTKSFRDNFIQLGGSGNTFMFTIMCAFMAKSEQLKSIGKLSLGPAIFQINEPIIFGIPIVLNPIMMIPFIASSLVGTIIGYVGTSLGLISRLPGIQIPWTTPPIVNAWINSNGEISVVVGQIIVLLVTALIYYPFFKIMDKKALLEESQQTN